MTEYNTDVAIERDNGQTDGHKATLGEQNMIIP